MYEPHSLFIFYLCSMLIVLYLVAHIQTTTEGKSKHRELVPMRNKPEYTIWRAMTMKERIIAKVNVSGITSEEEALKVKNEIEESFKDSNPAVKVELLKFNSNKKIATYVVSENVSENDINVSADTKVDDVSEGGSED